jgi:hypothetical protein
MERLDMITQFKKKKLIVLTFWAKILYYNKLMTSKKGERE